LRVYSNHRFSIYQIRPEITARLRHIGDNPSRVNIYYDTIVFFTSLDTFSPRLLKHYIYELLHVSMYSAPDHYDHDNQYDVEIYRYYTQM